MTFKCLYKFSNLPSGTSYMYHHFKKMQFQCTKEVKAWLWWGVLMHMPSSVSESEYSVTMFYVLLVLIIT